MDYARHVGPVQDSSWCLKENVLICSFVTPKNKNAPVGA